MPKLQFIKTFSEKVKISEMSHTDTSEGEI